MSFSLAAAVALSSAAQSTLPPAPAGDSGSKPAVELWLDLRANPAIGEDIKVSADDDRVDDSDYELALRLRRNLRSLRQLPFEMRIGSSAKPNTFDQEDPESTIFFETQLGDSFFKPGQLTDLQFEEAGSVDRKAVRPYVRYRLSRNYAGFITDYQRTDHAFTAGVRYRYSPFSVIDWAGREDGAPQPPIKVRATSFELRAELTRTLSPNARVESWNPRLQFDVSTPPFWDLTRFVVRGTAEVIYFDDFENAAGDKIIDKRLRVTAGFDVTEPVKDWLDLKRSKLTMEILGRWQRRWSNGENRDHSRAYFVPSISLSVPIE